MHVGTACIHVSLGRLLASASRPNTTGLVIGTVGAAHQLAVVLLTGEPRLEIVFFDGRIVQFVADQTNNTVGESEGIVEILGGFEHALVFGLGNLEVVVYQTELFDLFELMDTENSSNVPTGRSGFLSKARGDSGVSQRQRRLFDPFVLVVGTQRLFRGGDQVLFLAFAVGVVGLSRDLVELFVKVVELCDRGHNVLVHEERRLDDVVSACSQKGNTVIYYGLIQQNTGIGQEVGPVTSDIRSTGGFVPTDSPQEFIVGQWFGFRQGVLQFSLGSR
mmetsp:Transcript_11764/g.24873  ORF Transcript_11764/g.24873 Transcript_11764/m.24873 type:complete len:276 (-) Transcript_11764:577-1404(-)